MSKAHEIKRKLRAFAYRHAPKHVKKARYEAFNNALFAKENWRHEPRVYIADQPN